MRILGFIFFVAAAFARPVLAWDRTDPHTGRPPPASSVSSSFTIHIRDGSDLQAVLVEPWPRDFVRLTTTRKERTFVPFSKILAIRDGEGRDRTGDVLVRRETLGQAPLEPGAPPAEPPRVITTPISSFVIRKDSVLVASRVERIGSEKVVVTRVDGVSQSLPTYWVRWIRGLDGQDYTSAVVRKGKRVEEAPILVGYPATHWNFRRLRGQPMPYRSVFPLIQGGALGFLGSDDDYYRRGATAAAEIGVMRNLSRQFALGINGSLATDGRYQRYGIKSRARLWLTKDVALDVAPGIIGVDDSNPNWSTYAPGFTAETALSIADLIVLSASVESFREVMYAGTGMRYEQTNTSWYLGVKLGGELAIPGMIAVIGLRPHEFAPTYRTIQ